MVLILTLSGIISTLSNSIPLANKNFASTVVFTSATVPFNISSPIISAAALGRFTLYFLDADLVTNKADNRCVLFVFLVADTTFRAKEEFDPLVNKRYMVDRCKKIIKMICRTPPAPLEPTVPVRALDLPVVLLLKESKRERKVVPTPDR